jgi:predicted RND superfamily exporter protein
MRPIYSSFRFIEVHYRLVLFAALMLLAFLAWQAPKIKFDASADSLVLQGDTALDFAREMSKRYASEDFLLVTYEPDGELFSQPVLDTLVKLRNELAQVETVSSVFSILDAPLLYSPPVTVDTIADGLPVLLDERVDRGLAAQEFLNSPIYRGLLTNADNSVTALQVNLQRDETYFSLLQARDSLRLKQQEGALEAGQVQQLEVAERDFENYKLTVNEQQQRLVDSVREVLDKYRSDATVYLGGVPMIAVDLITFVKSDLVVFGSGILVFIVILLALIFRSPRWVVIPLLICASTAIGVLGWLAWIDWRLTVISSNFIAILLIINLSILVHLIVKYRELAAADEQATQAELVMGALQAMAKPCLYTTLTTLVAFATLVVSDIRPVMDFGLIMSFGVALALVTSFVLFPAFSMLLPRSYIVAERERPPFTRHFARAVEHHGGLVLLFSILIALAAVWGISRLEVENRFIDNFHHDTEIYQGMETIDRELGGTVTLDVIIEAGPEQRVLETTTDDYDDEDLFDDGGSTEETSVWFTRDGLDRVAAIHQYLDELPETGKVMSLAMIYQIGKDLAGENIDNIELALLKSNLPEEVSSVLIDPYLYEPQEQIRINLRVMETDPDLRRDALLKKIKSDLVNRFDYQPEQVQLTGMMVLYNNMLQSLFNSQIMSLGAVFFAILAMFVVLFRSFTLALIALLPNLLGAGMVLGIMGIGGIPLDMMTITIASICVGIGVDDAIHYVYRFGKEFELDRNYLAAMHRSHRSIGKAMYYTSLIVVLGFAILVFSNFRPSIYFGLLTGTAMLAMLLGDLLLLPKLILSFKPYGPEARTS